MSEFKSKIIKWNSMLPQAINCGSNSAKQDLFGFIIGHAKEKKFLNILDLGCGKGKQWDWYFKNRNRLDFKLDINGYEPFVKNTYTSKSKENTQIKFIKDLNKCNKEFDIVVSMSVLEHVYDRRNFLETCYKFMKSDGFSLINYDNGHFHNPKEWKRNIFGKILAIWTPIKRYYQDFVEIEEISKMAKDIGMKVDDYIDYHLLINKKRLNLIGLCEPNIRGDLIDKIQLFEREVSDIIQTKSNKLIRNKYSYSSTLILKK